MSSIRTQITRSRSRTTQGVVSGLLDGRCRPVGGPSDRAGYGYFTHESSSGAIIALALPFFLFAAVGLTLDTAAQASSAATGCTGAYGWPVTPFDQPHPIRGGFGDPRTVFKGADTEQTILSGDGSFSFHQGLDISAPDGSPVYAVASGTVVRARGGRVTVDCGNGRSMQYWHIDPIARVGQHAVAGRTVLGVVQPKREHIHLTHLENGPQSTR